MTASVAGSLLLVLIGVGFWCAALITWLRVGDDQDLTGRSRRVVGLFVDVLVGAVALVDGTLSVLSEPERVLVWSVGSVALVAAVSLLLVRYRQDHQLPP